MESKFHFSTTEDAALWKAGYRLYAQQHMGRNNRIVDIIFLSIIVVLVASVSQSVLLTLIVLICLVPYMFLENRFSLFELNSLRVRSREKQMLQQHGTKTPFVTTTFYEDRIIQTVEKSTKTYSYATLRFADATKEIYVFWGTDIMLFLPKAALRKGTLREFYEFLIEKGIKFR